MPFTIRLRTSEGVKRVILQDGKATWRDLKLNSCDVLNIPIHLLLLSKKPISSAEFLDYPAEATLESLGFSNGDILHVGGQPAPARPAKSAAAGSKLTPDCQHNEKGRCLHCDSAPVGEKIQGKCSHGEGVTCINCSKHVKDVKSEPAPWLCNHPESVFCPLCIPPENKDEPAAPKPPSCGCDNSKGIFCSRCLVKGPAIKVDLIPFQRFMDERKGLCKYRHGMAASCPACAPPPLPSYVGKPDCRNGHHPWPKGVCLSCAPAVPHLRSQGYRHCDTIQMSARLVQQFYTNYFRKGAENPRGAFIIGTYIDEPVETKNPGAIRGVMEAIYEPPQSSVVGRLAFTVDSKEATVKKVAELFGLEVIGWVIGRLPREGEKYGGKVFMTAQEIRMAAHFQNKYKNDYGYSRFVSIIVEHSEQIEPRAFMVSDQCVALERDGLLEEAKDMNMLATRSPKKGEMVPHIFYKQKRLNPGDEFLGDEFIVKVIAAAPDEKKSVPMFSRSSNVPSNATEGDIKQHFRSTSNLPLHERLLDFNLLVNLQRHLGDELLQTIIPSLKARKPLGAELQNRVSEVLRSKGLIS